MNYNKSIISLFVYLLFIAHITHINASKIPLEIEINNKNSQLSSSKKIEKAPEFVDKKYIKYIKKNIEIMEEQEATAIKKLIYYNKIPCPYDIEKAENMLNDIFDGNKEEWVKFLASCTVKFMMRHHTLQKDYVVDNAKEGIEVKKLLETYDYITSNYLKILNETNKYSIGISIQDGSDIMREELLFSLIKYSKKNTIEDELQKYFQYLVNLWNQANEETKKEIEKRIYKFIQCSGYYGFFEYALPYLTPNLANNCTLDEALLNNILVFINQSISSEFSGIDKKEVFNKIYSTLDLLLSKQIEEGKYRGNVKEILERFTITCYRQSNQLRINLEKQMNDNMNLVQSLQKKLLEFQEQKTKVENELVRFQKQTGNAENELARIKEQKTKVENELVRFQKQTDSTENELTKVKEQANKEKIEKNKLISDIAAYEEQKNELLVKQKESQNKINELEKLKTLHEKKFQTTAIKQAEENTLLIKRIDDLEKTIKKKDEDFKMLNESYKMLNELNQKYELQFKQIKNTATEQVELYKQQKEKTIDELKKTNEQLKKQLEDLKIQPQSLKLLEKQINKQSEGSFFAKQKLNEGAIACHLNQIKQELNRAQVICSQSPIEPWSQFAYQINELLKTKFSSTK